MKLTIKQDPIYTNTEIIIHCSTIDSRLSGVIQQIQLYAFSIPAKDGDSQYSIPLENIFYFESLEDKTFVYCKEKVLECTLRLYELEEMLRNTSFVRVGKSCLLNTSIIESVRPLLGGRIEATLDNKEKINISRHYVPSFKKKFGLE